MHWFATLLVNHEQPDKLIIIIIIIKWNIGVFKHYCCCFLEAVSVSNSPAVVWMHTVKTVLLCKSIKCPTSAFIPSPVEYFHESIVQQFLWPCLWILSMRALCRWRGALWVIGCKNGLAVFWLINWLIGVLCNVLRPAGRSGNGFQDGLCLAWAGNSWPEASVRCALVTGVCRSAAKRGWFQS